MLLKNSKKHRKHMLYYLMKVRDVNMTNLDIQAAGTGQDAG